MLYRMQKFDKILLKFDKILMRFGNDSFLTAGLDKAALLAALEAALLSDAELAAGEDSWREFEDAFFGGAYFEVKLSSIEL